MLQPISTAAARVTDLARGTISAFWPRGAAKWEMQRLLEEGYASGERCDVAFSVCFADATRTAAAAQAVRAARYAVDTTQSSRGFITVQEPLQLRAFDLGVAIARLERIVGAYEGFVALIGPTHPSPRAADAVEDTTDAAPGQLAA